MTKAEQDQLRRASEQLRKRSVVKNSQQLADQMGSVLKPLTPDLIEWLVSERKWEKHTLLERQAMGFCYNRETDSLVLMGEFFNSKPNRTDVGEQETQMEQRRKSR